MQIIAHAEDYNHMLLYTCLDTKLFGPSYCLHIVGRERSVPQSVVDGYVELAKSMNLYKPDIMRPVFHGQGCKYDPMPASMEETVNEESMFRVQI